MSTLNRYIRFKSVFTSPNFIYSILVKIEEARKAKILFAIVIFFMICNVPRTVLNLEEFAVIAPSYWRNYNGFIFNHSTTTQQAPIPVPPLCYSPPFWSHILGSVSNFFLTLNASICGFVYCVMCQLFRNELSKMLNNVTATIRKVFSNN